MKTWQERMSEEREELTATLDEIVGVLGSDLALEMDDTAHSLLVQQAEAMLRFQTALTLRQRHDREAQKMCRL